MLASRRNALRFVFGLAALVLPLVLNSVASAQLEGRPIAQPYFDFPNWARWSNCRPHPLIWQFDPFVPYAQGDCQSCMDGSMNDCVTKSNSCVDAFVAHRPNGIYAIGDFAPLTYDINHNVEIARIDPTGPLPAGPTTVSTGNIQNEFNAGGKFTLGYVYSPCVRIEGTYFGTYSWQDDITVTDPASSTVTILSDFLEDPDLDENNLIFFSQYSAFNSAEANIRYWLDVPPGSFDVSLTLGLRRVTTREQIAFRSERTLIAPSAINELAVRTDNDMWGGQLGFQVAWLQSAHTWLEFDGKAAMLHNNASQDSSFTQTLGGGVPANFLTGREQQRTAWLGDISAAYNIQFQPGLVLRLGYQAVFVNGVALAADNIQRDNTLLQNGPGQLDDRGEVVYHGPFIGLMYNR